ncbi:carboxypeptidase-like regulatory domain-containing protein [Deinococcus roseus]|uniref:Carboxypeptidase regulatory-like domain-containing protein n=1 Tax=Deinococcus roseus TaxID=392414 RepID=A0ABQ2CUJ9_9DEIO|nr:carboxypeptidase-like regulatory domain-containing protein [Deinococcus roseus]GGJ20830.1 hypothetical protein GCM10008938_03830 [Deinococcus roseus]
MLQRIILMGSILLGATLGTAASKPGTVQGQVLDAQGKPVEGAQIWIKPVVTTGVAEALTDEHGKYLIDGLPPVGYRAYAWMEVPYRGKTFCLRLAQTSTAEYNPFNPRDGIVRNFVWKTSGRIPDQDLYDDMGYFGGSMPLMAAFGQERFATQNDQIEVELTPTGPLIDGSKGKVLTKVAPARGYVLDVPVGPYQVKATFISAKGKREALDVSSYDGEYENSTVVEFKPAAASCKGSSASGSGRAYIYWKFRN